MNERMRVKNERNKGREDSITNYASLATERGKCNRVAVKLYNKTRDSTVKHRNISFRGRYLLHCSRDVTFN